MIFFFTIFLKIESIPVTKIIKIKISIFIFDQNRTTLIPTCITKSNFKIKKLQQNPAKVYINIKK